MMKKLTALILACVMLLSVSAMAETTAQTATLADPSNTFDVVVALPEGVTVGDTFGSDDFSYVTLSSADAAACSYILTIAPSEEYADVKDLGELSQEDLDAILAVIIADCDEVDYGVTTLESGDVMLYYIERGEGYEAGNLIDIHNGYFVQLTYAHSGNSTILESDTIAANALMDAITYTALN